MSYELEIEKDSFENDSFGKLKVEERTLKGV